MTKVGSHRVSVLSQQAVASSAAFSPTDLSGLVLWLDANEGITLNGSDVAIWADQSGNGNDASQGTAANQPAYSATSSIQSLPAVTFNTGGPEWLTVTGSTDFDCASGIDIFVVMYYPSAGDAGVLMRNRPLGALGSQDGFSIEHGTTDAWANFLCEMSGSYIINGSPSVTHQDLRPFVQNFRFDFPSVVMEVFENGVDQGIGQTSSGTISNMSQTDDLYIGIAPDESTRPANMTISEILIYNNYLSDANRTSVTDYLLDKWNLTISSPAALSPVSWFDASDTSTITESGGLVSLLTDKGSLGADVSASGTERPTTGAATLNGYNLIRFDGVANVLQTASFTGVQDLDFSFHCVCVGTNLNVGTNEQRGIFSTADANTNGTFEAATYFSPAPDQIRCWWSPGTPSAVLGVVSASGYVVGFTYDQSTDTLSAYTNGEAGAVNSSATMTDGVRIDTYKIGEDRSGGEFYEFDLGEIFIKHSVMTFQEIVRLHTYWQNKYQIP